MDRDEYVQRMEEKFSDTSTYVKIQKDPTQEIRQEIIDQLIYLEDSGYIDKKTHLQLHPNRAQIPRAYGSPKIHKEGYPLREIVDGTNSVTKKVDKYVSRIIKSYTVGNQHAVKNSKDFVDKIQSMSIPNNHKMISFDVVALYPSVPQEEALEVFEECLMSDVELKSKTNIPVKDLMKLFRTCLKRTYFVFNNQLYQQVDGLAIGASSSVFLAEIFMMRLERRALQTFANPPDTWFRYVDDTFTHMLEQHIQSFLDHLNNQHERIKFTIEYEEDRSIPFLDTKVTIEEDGSISTNVFRKKTHTNQYLDFHSNHHARQKIGIISTLMKRINIISKEEDKTIEQDTVKNAFRACGYPEWVVNKDQSQKKKREKEKEEFLTSVSIPYNKGISESFARIMKKYKVDTIHKPSTTIKNVLCSKAKDKLHPMDKPGVVYSIYCKAHDNHYVGETSRAAKERLYEHYVMSHEDSKKSHSLQQQEVEEVIMENIRRSQRGVTRKDYKAMNSGSHQRLTVGDTAVSEHMALNDHKEGDIEIKLLDFEPHWKKRLIKETIAISKLKPDLNGNEGKYLSAIYDLIPSKFERVGRSNNPEEATESDITNTREVLSNRQNANQH